jgi:hypothetical protein
MIYRQTRGKKIAVGIQYFNLKRLLGNSNTKHSEDRNAV